MELIAIQLTGRDMSALRREFPHLSADDAATHLFTQKLREKKEALKKNLERKSDNEVKS